jgi:hypothetical protein
MSGIPLSSRHLMVTLLACAAASAQAANEVRAYAGVVAGNASGTGAFACATSGPTIGDGWFAGLRLPTEGIAGCNLNGGADDKVGAAGPLTSSFAASGPMVNVADSYSGTAQTRADYWNLLSFT